MIHVDDAATIAGDGSSPSAGAPVAGGAGHRTTGGVLDASRHRPVAPPPWRRPIVDPVRPDPPFGGRDPAQPVDGSAEAPRPHRPPPLSGPSPASPVDAPTDGAERHRPPPLSGPDPALPIERPSPVGPSPGGGHSDGFRADPAVLHGAAGTFDAEADALAQLAASASAQLAAIGAPWGDDAVGARFATTYRPAAETVLTNLGALATGLARIASATRAVAASYTAADSALVDAARAADLDPESRP